ncbi:hypothetical protein CN676_09725 [Bacillus wiedmannii]|uniref:Group-specific protein n=1 Tax=Bacillus wiedmannii TaxID=1890302 RepID=A0AB73RS35_9BACI|nr:hypothetical protein [Bacillus wiedmannii]PEJ53568.1 hypothetical protein CN676_09725 [Bacillus wiedmannii]PEK24986.1 hypothetical protein CN694_11405 [Bacillus wiedmannii]PGA33222.1 hypothetical protein COL74_15830 [Bacillus wiedmannii]PHC00862.1 hypothetical protein COE96_04485 [Bacillus wiedmannii]
MKQEILKLLDKKQRDYDFPTLDNEDMDISQVKLSIFINDNEDWSMVFQFVGVDSLGVSNVVHMLSEKEDRMIADDTILQLSNEDYELFDDRGNFIPDLYSGNLKIRNQDFTYEFLEKDYKNKGIHVKSTESHPIYLMRMLAEDNEARKLLWLDTEEILEELDLAEDWKLWYETEEWKHITDEKVSENEFFQSIAEAIEKKDSSLIVNKHSNTHWKNWVEFDFEN